MKLNKKEYSINIGRGVGNELEDLLINAKKRIWIVSPWISEKYAKLLLKKHEEGLDVKLITTTSYNNQSHVRGVNYLIKQKNVIDAPALAEFRRTKTALIYGSMLFALVGILASNAFLFVIGIISIIFSESYNKNFGHYEYYSPFELKVCKTIYSDNTSNDFIHAKIYLIDRNGALGSVNMTNAGLWKNIESFIRIKNKDAVLALEKEFNSIKKHPYLSEKNLYELGKYIYEEPETKT